MGSTSPSDRRTGSSGDSAETETGPGESTNTSNTELSTLKAPSRYRERYTTSTPAYSSRSTRSAEAAPGYDTATCAMYCRPLSRFMAVNEAYAPSRNDIVRAAS